MVAVAAWLGGLPAGDGLRSRAAQAWNSLRGGGGVPVVAKVELRSDASALAGMERNRTLMEKVLEAQERGLASQAAALSMRR